jgi:hypothetical protein
VHGPFDGLPFRQVWACDFEFQAQPGERPVPLCLVARELRTGQLERLWMENGAPDLPDFGTGPDSLFVAYYASAELGCYLALNWPMPVRILDLFTEFRCLTNGRPTPCGSGLLGAMAYYGLDAMAAAEKEQMRELALRGGPYTPAEQAGLLDYCQADVEALARLLPAMLPHIDLPRALLRGRYMAAAARMEWAGVPIDTEAMILLRERWDLIKGQLIAAVDRDRGIYVPAGRRPINPDTAVGAAILETARDWSVDPHALADALDWLWGAERQAGIEGRTARRAARRATGLTARRIGQLEDAGHDSTAVRGLDGAARDLAGLYPELGIGVGYEPDGPDEAYAGRLWEVLRDRDEATTPKTDPGLLRRAAEMVRAAPPADPYTGSMTFSAERFAAYLGRHGIPWPRLESGALALDDETFREMARAYPEGIGPIRELRHAMSQLRLNDLAVGADGRNRVLLSAFRARTGRNAPSNARFIFGPSTWLRSLIKPGPGRAVAYIDWSQQELGIAAALSGDGRMQEAYRSGDFYLTFAKMAGAVPPDATKVSHAAERDQFKTVALGVLYGLSAEGLARKLAVPPCRGRELLRMHQETFRAFWRWSDLVEMEAMLTGKLRTVFGWTIHVGPDANPRSLRNFPMQANGAEMLRLACCLATERGIHVCAPVHDALLIESNSAGVDRDVARTEEAMREASEVVLDGFSLRAEAKVIRHPGRIADPRGSAFWGTVWGLVEGSEPVAPAPPLAPVQPVAPAPWGS